MRNRTLYWVLGIIVVSLFVCTALGLYILRGISFGIIATDTDTPTVTQIESYGRLKLPPSATGVQAHLEGFQDKGLYVRFEMDPADEPAFWASTLCASSPEVDSITPPASADLAAQFDSLKRPWWRPDFSGKFIAREATGNPYQAILITHKTASHDTVHVCCFEF